MDRNTIIGYILIVAIFVGYLFLTQRNVEDASVQEQYRDSVAAAMHLEDSLRVVDSMESAQAQAAAIAVSDSTGTLDSTDSTAQAEQVAEVTPEVLYVLENDVLKVSVTNHGGGIARVELKDYKKFDSTDLVLLEPSTTEFSYLIPLNDRVINTGDEIFDRVSSDDSTLVVENTVAGGGRIRYTYKITDTYKVDYAFQLIGMANEIPGRHNGFDLEWFVGLHQQEKDLKRERDATSVYYKYKAESGIHSLSDASDEEEELHTNLQWVSYKQKFFNSTLIFPEGLSEGGTKVEIKKPDTDTVLEYASSSYWVPYNARTEETVNLEFYFGPNHYQTLKKEGIGLEKIIPMGKWIIGWVNKWLIVPIFNFLNRFISNYGLIILLLTIIIKGMLLFPMYKIYVSSAKMKLLKPELDELKAKYGGDMQRMQQEQMKLYKQAGVSPFGGCLPQLIQFPILLAMFRFFPSSIELRQQGFLWATDLSSYDVIYSWTTHIPFISNYYGNHISLFTLLMAGSTLLYTAMNTSQMSAGAGGNQMKYIMYLMPVFLLFWFNNYSSGLSYYYFLANMITFGQNWVFRNFIVDDAKLHRQIQENKKRKGTVKKSNWQKRLEKMAKQRGIDPKTGQRR